jgi:integrase
LGVRVTAKGTKNFLVQWTDPATKRKVRERLGVWGSITLEQARTAARVRLGDVAKGVDPSAERKRRKSEVEAERAEQALTLDTLLDHWSDLHLSNRRPRYAAEATRAVRLAFAEHLKRPASRLTRGDTIGVLDGLVRAGKATTAGRTMAYGRACYAWAAKRGRVPANPFEGLPIGASATERDRVLSDNELHEAWHAAGALSYPFGPFYQLAILTLQRREEVAGMRWSELSSCLNLWTIPADRMKNRRPHDVHLPQPAREILRKLPRQAGSDLVFTTTGKTPISGYSKAKAQLDAAILKAQAKEAEETGRKPAALVPWRLHDMRRTGVSRLAAMGFDSIVADKLLAHKPAKLKGVASVYQRHDFAAERRKALEAWADHVSGAATTSNVVPFAPPGQCSPRTLMEATVGYQRASLPPRRRREPQAGAAPRFERLGLWRRRTPRICRIKAARRRGRRRERGWQACTDPGRSGCLLALRQERQFCDAREKITELHRHVAEIGCALDDLSEVALKGFAFEARRISAAYAEGRSIWAAIASEADRAREIKARRRRGKGVWYAVVNFWRAVDAREMRSIDTVWERSDGKAAAVKVAQRLLAENAHRFSEDVKIEAELFCDLEWQPSGADDANEIVAVDAGRSVPR